MKLKTMFGVALAALMGACILLPSNVQAQKKKKEKKAYEWKWDGELSGNETVDGYLLSCDTLWTEIQSYRKDIDQFDYVEDTLTIHDKTYLVVHLENKEGQIFTTGTANWQLFQSVMSGLNIVLSSTQIGLQTASATLSLPQLGLKALSFGKYVKAGPTIIGIGMKEIKGIVEQRRYQWGQWKQAKEGAVDAETIDWASLGLSAEMPVDKLKKCFFIKEVTPQAENYEEIITIQQNKTDEQKKADMENFLANAQKEQLPEDASKQLDEEMSEDDMNKLLEQMNANA